MCFLECRSTPLSFAKFSLKQICANRYRNALLPFAKQNRSRAGAIPVCFAGIGTHHCHSRNKIWAAHYPGAMLAFYGCKNVPLPVAERFYKPPKRRARRRRKNLGFALQDTVQNCIFIGFEMLFESVSEGFRAFWKPKILKISPAAGLRVSSQ